MNALCTSGVVYPAGKGAHHVPMVRKIPKNVVGGASRGAKPLRWRKTQIRAWREEAGKTQQEVADALTTRGLELDRVSIGRIEAGDQMPSIEVIEAMADIFGIDVDTMLNVAPAEAEPLRYLRRLSPTEQKRAVRAHKAIINED